MSDKPKNPTEKAEEYVTTVGGNGLRSLAMGKKIYLAGHTEGRREALEMAQGLVNALKGTLSLIDENVLVRNTDADGDIMKFMEQGARIIAHFQACNSTLAKFEEWKDGK